jgi:septum formation protein
MPAIPITESRTLRSLSYLYLASQSPRRKQLLEQIGVQVHLLLPDASEDTEGLEARVGREAPARYVQRVTLLKAQAAIARLQARALPLAPVLCADTTVALGGDILGKPESSAEAEHMLMRLAGRTHRVLTAVVVALPGKGGRQGAPDLGSMLSVSQVRFRACSRAEIQAYVRSGEPQGKAGAYAIQGRAAGFIEHISGSYSGIMGLPLFETMQLLKQFKVDSHPSTSR